MFLFVCLFSCLGCLNATSVVAMNISLELLVFAVKIMRKKFQSYQFAQILRTDLKVYKRNIVVGAGGVSFVIDSWPFCTDRISCIEMLRAN